jgi:hypothetical protein
MHKTKDFLSVFPDMKEILPRASLAEKGVSFSGTLIAMKENSRTAGKQIFVSYYVPTYTVCLSSLTPVREQWEG